MPDSSYFYRPNGRFSRFPVRPRILNLTSPSSQNAYELLLDVKSKIGVLHEITGFLATANIDILSMDIMATRGKTAVIVAFIEMGAAKTSIEGLLREVRELDFVIDAQAAKKDGVLFEEFLFPIMVNDDIRGFLMTDTAWMSIATKMVLTYGTGGLAILHEAGVACGEEYGRHLQTKLGLNSGMKASVNNLRLMLLTMGLGEAEMVRTAEGFLVKVREPIISAKETKFYDHFLTGVIAGAAGLLTASNYDVENVRFEGNELSFKLGRRNPQPGPQETPQPRIETVRQGRRVG